MPDLNHKLQHTILVLCLFISTIGHAVEWTTATINPYPTKTPDHIILNISQDPTTSQPVTWRTDTTVTNSRAEIAEAEASPNFTAGAIQVQATTENFNTDDYSASYHSVIFTNLKPNTLYAYRVGADDNWSEWFQFRTASKKSEPFRFIYLGDGQDAILSLWSRAIRAAYSAAPNSSFIVHGGDLAAHSDNFDEWNQWFAAAGWINGMVPIVVTPGNHEYYHGHGKKRYLTDFWKVQFTLPENGIDALRESNYFFNYQGARIISLNSNEMIDEQAKWLQNNLKSNPNRWTILTFHHPIYSGASGRDQKKVRNAWQPIFRKYGVDLVLNGHDHTYARGQNIDANDGIVYVVSVSGPKQYILTDEKWMKRCAENTQMFHIISIDGNTLNFKACTVTGQLYDEFDIIKNPSGPNTIVDKQNPGIPERRFGNTP